MRVPPPGLLKLDREALLRDVRERLAERIPHYRDTEYDPTDPGWLLLEQAAWIAEILSEQLDRYPFSVVQQFVHMMGGQLRPAQPAIGMVVCQVTREGELKLDPKRPSPWRFFTRETETLEGVEFVPVESGAHLRKGMFKSVSSIRHDELYLVGPKERADGAEGLQVWCAPPRRSEVFRTERIVYTAVTNNVETLMEAMKNAIGQLEERRIGWLRLEFDQVGREKVVLTATIDPARAFERVAPAGIWMGGDIEGDWGTLDGSTWTPSVTIAEHPMLPPNLHGQYPLPGHEEGQIILTDIPENFKVEELLVRKASPTPEAVIESVWRTLANLDARLAPIKPAIRTRFDEQDEASVEPDWVAAALASGAWTELGRNQPTTVFHIGLTGKPAKGKARVVTVYETPYPDSIPVPRFFGMDAKGAMDRAELKAKEAWRTPAAPRLGEDVMPTLVAYDVEVSEEVVSVLVGASQGPVGACLNGVLVANLPAVNDGRYTTVDRNVPVESSMLFEDLVTPAVMEQLLEEPIPRSTAKVLNNVPLAYFGVDGQEPILDWRGVRVDPSEGTMTVNAPDRTGEYRVFRPGAQIRFDWYRRTVGAQGNQPPNTIRLIDQPSTLAPTVVGVTNPLGTFFGSERESPEAAIDRMFGPAGGTPVLATDFEREIRNALGSRGRRWLVRCWTYSERALVSTATWPFSKAGEEPESETVRFERAVDGAGPDTLLVVVGPPDGMISDDDLDWARKTAQRLVQRVAQRLPNIRRAEVTRFWPLRMEVEQEEHLKVTVPCFDLTQFEGKLTDPTGRTSTGRPRASLLLNAAVVDVAMLEQEVL